MGPPPSTSLSDARSIGEPSLGSCRDFYRDLPSQYTLRYPKSAASSYVSSDRSVDTMTCDSESMVLLSDAEVPVDPPGCTMVVPDMDAKDTLGGMEAVQESDNADSILCDRVKVAVRLRPLQTHELIHPPRRRSFTLKNSSQGTDNVRAWSIRDEGALLQTGTHRPTPGRHLFQFDSVFGEDASTEDVYRQVGYPMVQAVLTGRHATCFSYGQTGSGKTFTMQGEEGIGSLGMIQMAAADLFTRISTSTDRDFVVRTQFFEIYNEQIRDLLVACGCEDRTGMRRSDDPSVIKLRDDAQGNPTVNAKQVVVECVEDILRVLQQGNRNRAVAATDRNDKSSRSHAIFRFTVESRERHADDKTMRLSVLNMVDLAGSENGNQSGSTIRRWEGGKINLSLLSLSKVIHSLSLPEGKRPKHIGYRDSKLTRILQPHLSGNACMSVLCCASASHLHLEESRSTFKFAASAKEIELKPVVNEVVDKEKLMLTLQKELADAKRVIQELQNQLNPSPVDSEADIKQSKSMRTLQTTPTDKSSTETSSVAVVGPEIEEAVFERLMQSMNVAYCADEAEEDHFPVEEIFINVESEIEEAIRRDSEAEQRAEHLREKLEATDKLVAALVEELGQLRQNALKYDSSDEKSVVQHSSVEKGAAFVVKASFYLAVAFYCVGLKELCLATILFMWLSMEATV